MPDETIKTCTTISLPWQKQVEAAAKALEVHEGNAPDPALFKDALRHPGVGEPEAAVMFTGKLWKPGQTITVSFVDDPYGLRAVVSRHISRWLDCANLHFQFLPGLSGAGDVRITFARGGSWSYIGTDCLVVGKDRPTMQLGWLDSSTDETEIRRVVVHEAGHMMGLGHEHQSPAGGIPWNKAAVYDYYQRTQGWSHSEVDAQVLIPYSVSQTQYTKWDPHSIMEYPIPAELLTDPSKQVGWNTRRTHTDRAFVSAHYPR